MARILIAELKQETATFNPVRTTLEDFRIHRGEEILEAYSGTKTELAGAFEIFAEDESIELVPTMAAAAVSGGPIDDQDLNLLIQEILETAEKQVDIDGIYLCLHGAMAGESDNDPEGRLLAKLRQSLGEIPLVASIDLHAIITDRLVEAADILVPYHTYPHVDHFETGQRAARLLLRLIRGEIKPTTARVELPMLVRGDELLTDSGKFGEAIRMCQEIENSPGGLAAGVIIGNAFTDVPDLQSNVIVTTDNDPDRAELEAERIGCFMWKYRELFQAELTPLDEAIRIAEATKGLTIFSDGADATASGASGDSNEILKGLIEHRFSKLALVPIVDAPAVKQAWDLGGGKTARFSLGGTRDLWRFKPLTVEARVERLYDEIFEYEDGTEGYGGQAALLTVGKIWILVTERPVFVVGQQVFQAHELEPSAFDLIVVKSPNGYRPYYESIAACMIPIDVPGSTSANLKSLPYRHCRRPIFPLDDDAECSFA